MINKKDQYNYKIFKIREINTNIKYLYIDKG